MELRQLEYFVAVAEELGGLGRAAERLRTAPEAVMDRIDALERTLGLILFDRQADGAPALRPPRTLRLTAAGESLLPEARAALAAAGRVRETAAGIAAGTEGLVRLGTSRAFADRVYRALGTLADGRPRLRVRLERAPQDARLAAVRSGTFDAALVRTVRRAPGLVLHPVWTDPLIVALPAAHPLAAYEAPLLGRLARLPLRLAPREANPAFHDLVTAAVPDWTPGPPFTTLADTLTALATASEPSWTVFYPVGALPQSDDLAFRTLPSPRVPVSLAIRADTPAPPPVQALLDALTATGAPAAPAAPTVPAAPTAAPALPGPRASAPRR
ncbi:LysR family transcriptional regulator [Streptomyces sp. TRM64462]|uniref:LysR family transcriptional regulator n=1 Tax=Streptomyces sp. TRM64462 TaxID=2741726 RepID=UPI001586E5D3|nr:LysR family transcriptional regulator [Streptomyces sp. TRM64462]